MGIYLNQGNALLYNSKTYSEIYIDKSMMIDALNAKLFGEDKFVCVSRPRRFGKSMAAQMLVAYYSRGCDSRELFADMKIAGTESFKRHLNQYNVIHLTMTDFQDMSITEMKNQMKEILLFDLEDEKEKMKLPPIIDLPLLFKIIYDKTGIPFIFIIDEWDCLMRMQDGSESKQKEYLDFLRYLLKDREYVALAYMTGILPVKKYGEHSALNMFKEFSMENQREFSEYTGFTNEEVTMLCRKYDMDMSEIQKWYDGYRLGSISVYNPRSVVCAMTDHEYDSYWTKTETYEALKKYILLNMDGLRDKVERLISGEKISIDTGTFRNDMTNLSCADDVLTLLVHLGYLTYDHCQKTCWIPNAEVAQEFVRCIKMDNWSEVMNAINQSEKCMKATLSGDESTVARIIEQTHRENTSIIKYNDENSLSCVVTLSYYTARNQYITIREYPTGDGFADIVFLPRPGEEVPAIVVELKRDKDPSIAIDQIKNRHYPEALKAFSGEILLVGVNYVSESGSDEYKKHSCRIEKISK